MVTNSNLYLSRSIFVPRWMLTKAAYFISATFFVAMFYYFLVTEFRLFESVLLTLSLFFAANFLMITVSTLYFLIRAQQLNREFVFFQSLFLSVVFLVSASIISVFSTFRFEGFPSPMVLICLLLGFFCILWLVFSGFFFLVWKGGALLRGLIKKLMMRCMAMIKIKSDQY